MKNKIMVCLLTLFFFAIAFWFGYVQWENMDVVPVEFCVPLGEKDKIIQYWEDENNCCYVFLPGCAELSQVKVCLNTLGSVEIDGEIVKNEMSCEKYVLDCEYTFSYNKKGVRQEKQLIFVRSANVATMFIDTDSRSMDHIYQEKGNEESGNIVLYTADGQLNYEGRIDALKGRGNATWSQYMKKPFAMKLDNAADLLGMGTAEKWILLANAGDDSHMRNKIVYDFAAEVNLPYSPDTEWVDLYLNGEYAGLYLLSERIEIGENRVAIDETSNSYIASMEMLERLYGTDELYVTTASGETLRLNDPTNMSNTQLQAIAGQWQSVENAILAEDGIDPITGKSYLELIDLDSWARKYLIEEVFANVDGGAISQYFYCIDGEFPIYAGPVWDYDSAMGDSRGVLFNGLIANREYFDASKKTLWFHSLYNKDEFYNRVVEIYENEFLPKLEHLYEEKIPEYEEQIAVAASMDEIRWSKPEEHRLEAGTKFLVDFMTDRTDILTDIWVNDIAYCHVCVDPGYGGKYLYYAVKPGDNLDILTLPKDTLYVHYVGWRDKETDEPIDISEPIFEDKFLYIFGEMKEQ